MKKYTLTISLILFASIFLTACGQQSASVPLTAPDTATATLQPTATATSTPTVTPSPTNTVTPTLTPTPISIASAIEADTLVELDVLSTGNVFDYKYSPKFSYFAIAVARGVYLYPVEELYGGNTESRDFIDFFNEPFVFTFSPDEQNIALGFGSGMIKILDLKSRQYILEFQAYKGPVSALAYSPDGQTIASSGDTVVSLWDATTGLFKKSERVRRADHEVIYFSHDGKWLITGGSLTGVFFWNPETLTIRQSINWGADDNSIAISPDQNLVTIKAGSGPVNSKVQVWDLDSMKQINSANSIIMPGLSFLSGDIALVGCGQNICKTNVRTFDMEILKNDDGKIGYVHGGKKILINPNSKVMSFPHYRFEERNKELYNNYYFFDYSNGKLLLTLEFSPEFSSTIVNRLSDSDEMSQKIGLGRFGQEYVLSITNMAIEKLKSEILEGQEYETFALSGDSKLLATGETNGTIKLWDLRNKTLLHTITAHRSVREFYSTLGINQLQFSPDNLTLVSVGYDQLLRAWNVETGERTAQTNISQPRTRTPIVFLEDGSHFFLISDRAEIKMFSAETYRVVATLRGADQLTSRGAYNIISSMKMSPDGNYFIYSDRNGNLIFWDPYEQKSVKSLRFPVGKSDLSFSDGGDLMFVTLFGGIVSVWGAPMPQP